MKHSSVCVLVSGGLDSGVMIAELAKRYTKICPVFVRQGLFWEPTELRHLRRFLRSIAPLLHHSNSPLHILDLPARDLYGNHWSTTGRKVPGAATPDEAVYLPGRNLLLLSKASVFCARNRIGAIAIGSLGHNPFPDATPEFFHKFARAVGAALNFRFKIVAPFSKLTKEQVVRHGVRMRLPLHLSFSCISPKRGLHCGRCNKCAERQRAFRATGVVDKTKYAS